MFMSHTLKFSTLDSPDLLVIQCIGTMLVKGNNFLHVSVKCLSFIPAQSYVGEKGGYDDPSSAVSLSIHDCFSRFITVHGTHEAIVRDNVGYNTHGHGFFLEDGYESDNWITGNLGILVKPGIILPSDRHASICKKTKDGFNTNWDTRACDGLSVFWVSNMNNHFHDNAAVGGHTGFWSFTHSSNDFYQFDAIPVDPAWV